MTAELLARVRAEIDGRLAELRPAVAEYERLLGAGGVLDTDERAAPATRGATQQAILAALEHGSHTVAELVLVTAMSGAAIRAGVKPLLKSGTVRRARREGRPAYALSSTA
jgi:RNase P/RNase MRP subunit POP5